MIRQLIHLILLVSMMLISRAYSQDTTSIVITDTIEQALQDSINLDLLIASEEGNFNAVLEALRSGADVNARSYYNVTPLMYASQSNHLDIVKILLHNGADPNATPQDGTSALMSAVIFNNVDVADILIQNGAKINKCDKMNVYPLMYAAAYGYYIMTDMLIFYGADIDIRDNDSTNAIMLASLNGKTEIVELLIDKGADVNSNDSKGFSPLTVAAQNGHLDITKILIENGADVSKKTKYGTNALYYSVNNGYTDIVNLLLDSGADVNQDILDGRSLNSLPHVYKYPLIRKSLRKNGLRMNYWPGFSSINIGYGLNFNNKDMLSGGIVGGNDYKFNLGLTFGFEMRYWSNRTLVEDGSLYYQFWEKRYSIFLSAEKRFNIFNLDRSDIGCLLGAKTLYTFGSYRGTSMHPESKLKFTPQLGFYYSMNLLMAKIIYEYIDYGNYEVPPHRINLQVCLKLDFRRYNKYEKEVFWLY